MSDTMTHLTSTADHAADRAALALAPSERLASERAYTSSAGACADLVHEINNPLAVSLLSAQLALRSLNASTPKTVRMCLDRAITCIQAAANAARVRSHEFGNPPEFEFEFDIRDVIRFAVVVTQPQAVRLGCQLTQSFVADPCVVRTSPVKLQTALAGTLYALAEFGAPAISISTSATPNSIVIHIACEPGPQAEPSTPSFDGSCHELSDLESLSALFESQSLETAFCKVAGAQCSSHSDDRSCILSISFPRSNQ